MIGVAEIAITSSLSRLVSLFFSNFQRMLMALDGCFEQSQTLISVAEIAITFSLSDFVSHLFSNF